MWAAVSAYRQYLGSSVCRMWAVMSCSVCRWNWVSWRVYGIWTWEEINSRPCQKVRQSLTNTHASQRPLSHLCTNMKLDNSSKNICDYASTSVIKWLKLNNVKVISNFQICALTMKFYLESNCRIIIMCTFLFRIGRVATSPPGCLLQQNFPCSRVLSALAASAVHLTG